MCKSVWGWVGPEPRRGLRSLGSERVDNSTCGVGRGRVAGSVYASPEGTKASSSVIGRDGDEAGRPSEGVALDTL